MSRADRVDDGGYASLTTEEQVDVLRDVAREGALAFGLDSVEVQLVAHAFNTTFRVEGADGERVAVRVNTNSLSTPGHITAQHAWMRALASDTDLRLPVPLQTVSGSDYAVVRTDDHDHVVVAASWLEGDEVGECDEVQARALGRAMAAMHAHAEAWTMPEDGGLSEFTDPYFGDEDRLRDAYRHRPEDLALVEWSLERCQAAMTAAAETDRPIVVHGDLHGGNLLWHEGVLGVLDFDDCGIAVPAVDLAVATFYLRGSDPQVEAALRAGYAEVRELPGVVEDGGFDGLVAARQLLLANDLLQSRTAELQELAVGYLERTVERLGRWREGGRFTL
ncbi:MAG: phosphotransferase enzyme family protein [Dermatophilaceae bacterium]|nr:phosphotransferase [Intrasporangiaceae bacterium]